MFGCRKINILLFIVCYFIFNECEGQLEPSYNISCLKGFLSDTTENKDVIVLFLVTPKDNKNYPPLLSMKISYKLNDDEKATVVDIQKQKENKVRVSIYGYTINQANPIIYNLVKEKIDALNSKDFMLLAFEFRDITTQPLNKMKVTYGLWEKRKSDTRIEKEYDLSIDR